MSKKGGARNTGKKMDIIVKSDIEKYENNKCKKTYTEILDSYTIHDGRQKCIYCGEDIYYDNIVLCGIYGTDVKIKRGSSYITSKDLEGKCYGLKVCEDCMRKKFPEWDTLNRSKIFNRPCKYSEYAFDIPHEIIKKKTKEFCARTLESFIKKYGKEEGERRWESYRQKQAYTNSFEYKLEKYGMTKEEFDAYNKSRAVTKKNMIDRYGEDEGLRKWNEYIKKQAYTTSREYFIETYGKKEGSKKWEDFHNAKDFSKKRYSNISQELFNWVVQQEPYIGHNHYYETLNYEYEVFSNETGKLYCLDFLDINLGICIEFNGNAFHPSPDEYNEDDMFYNPFACVSGERVGDIWERERDRYNALKKERNIDTIVVWERDYNSNKEKVHEYILNETERILKTKKYG